MVNLYHSILSDPMRTSLIQITNTSKNTPPVMVRNCTNFAQKLRGLMFEPSIPPYGGILLDESTDSIVNSSIHMLFMNFDITAIWINSNNEVVDVKLARKWALAYFPQKPARYILETSAQRFDDFSVGDHLSIAHVE